MKRTQKGFTLVELLVVIAILAILATVSVVGYTSFIGRVNQSNLQTVARQIEKFIDVALILPGSTAELKEGLIVTKSGEKIVKTDTKSATKHSDLKSDLAELGGDLAYSDNMGLSFSKYGYSYSFNTDAVSKQCEHTEEILAAVAPTYNQSGRTEGKHCFLCGAVLAEQAEIPTLEHPKWESGTIRSASGENGADSTRIRTVEHLPLSEYGLILIGDSYQITCLIYDKDKNYLGSTSWLEPGKSFSPDMLISNNKFNGAFYFRIVMRLQDSGQITPEDVSKSGIKYHVPGEEANDLKIKIGAYQDGAIYEGKLFALGGAGTGAVFSITSGAKIGAFNLDISKIKPHANSVCFGSEKYEENDTYPLLYVNVYNNYSSSADRMEGTCCVYRIVESGGSYTGELVQIIRIGFVNDLSLWKSKENNGDVRPYGNFVVDTDNNMLYAYVMRDADKTTRFFGFDLPRATDGTYSESYGCNVVVLQAADIKTQFDTQYFNYMQGVCYYDGKIISTEGFSEPNTNKPFLRVVDLKAQTVIKSQNMSELGLTSEPEIIAVNPKTGKLYYVPIEGTLHVLASEVYQ